MSDEPQVAVLCTEDVVVVNRTYRAGAIYTLPPDTASDLERWHPGVFSRVQRDGPLRRDRTVHGKGVRHR